jgi:hypothetical protein
MKYTLLGILCLITVNCATFTDYNPEVKEIEFKKTGNATKTILVNVKQKIIMNGNPLETNSKSEENAREKFATILKESFLFKDVKSGLDTADMKLLVDLENRGEANQFLAFLTGLSLFLIPGYAQDDVHLKYSFMDNKDKPLKEYKRQVTFNTWMHLFLIPIMPFKFPIVAHSNGIEAVTKSVLDEANRDGILK